MLVFFNKRLKTFPVQVANPDGMAATKPETNASKIVVGLPGKSCATCPDNMEEVDESFIIAQENQINNTAINPDKKAKPPLFLMKNPPVNAAITHSHQGNASNPWKRTTSVEIMKICNIEFLILQDEQE